MFAQQSAEFVLKAHLPMVLFLGGDAMFDRVEIRLADGEVGIAALPLKVGVFAALWLKPGVGDAFHLLDPFGLGDRAGEARQQMDMVLDSADQKRRAVQGPGDGSELGVRGFANGLVPEERPSFFGGEHQMNVNR